MQPKITDLNAPGGSARKLFGVNRAKISPKITEAINTFREFVKDHSDGLETAENMSYPLYHYTTPPGIISILGSQCLWSTQVECFGDQEEFHLGLGLAKKAIDNEFPKIASPWVRTFCHNLRGAIDKFSPETFRLCANCLCKHGDLPWQWQNYADNGRGARIAISKMAFEWGKVDRSDVCGLAHVYPMVYDENEALNVQTSGLTYALQTICQKDVLRQIDVTANRNRLFKRLSIELLFYFSFNAIRYKKSEFRRESEVRILLINETSVLEPHIKVINRDGKPFRYVEYPFDKPLNSPGVIKNIVLGPQSIDELKRQVEHVLRSGGYPEIPISRANASV